MIRIAKAVMFLSLLYYVVGLPVFIAVNKFYPLSDDIVNVIAWGYICGVYVFLISGLVYAYHEFFCQTYNEGMLKGGLYND